MNVRNSKFIELSSVEEAKKAIQNKSQAEPCEKTSFRQAITAMYDDITAMMEKGHKWESVVDTLKGNGIEIKLETLRTYMYDIKRERKKEGKEEEEAA